MIKRIMLSAAALVALAALWGCAGQKDDEATKLYKGPGPSKAGAPSANPGAGPAAK